MHGDAPEEYSRLYCPVDDSTVLVVRPPDKSVWPHLEISPAHAHLIAASPELLEALQAMIDQFGDLSEYIGWDAEKAEAVIESARAAQAKAEGTE